MEFDVQRILGAGAAVATITVAAHSGSPPHTGYRGPDIETACENIKIDSDGTLSGTCHEAVAGLGETDPDDEDYGPVGHVSTSIELKDKIQFANGSLSRGGSGRFDSLCSNIKVTVTSTAVTLGADCDDDPDDNAAATAETLDISDNIIVHDGAGEFDWYVDK